MWSTPTRPATTLRVIAAAMVADLSQRLRAASRLFFVKQLLFAYALMRTTTFIAGATVCGLLLPQPDLPMRQRRHFIRRKAVASDAANELCASPYATALFGATCHLTHIFCVNSHQLTYQRRTEPIPEAGFQPEGITLLMQAAAPSA